MDDGRVELHDNAVERSIRGINPLAHLNQVQSKNE